MKRLTYAKAIYDDKEKSAVMRSLDSGWLSGGVETAGFEKEFCDWWGARHALSVNSGSVADLVAMQALGLPPHSEVITAAGAAFPTTISSIIYLGLEPVFVDVKNWTIDPEEIKKAITPNTSAIFFAHTLGKTADMDAIMQIAKENKLRVIEDCCDALGSMYKGKKVGTFGDAATVSFYPAHHMTTGEGGMVITNSARTYNEALSIRDWGRACVCKHDTKGSVCNDRFSNPPFDHRYYYTRIGLNFKMTEMQAAFGREQIKRLDGFNELRKRNYKILADMMGEEFNADISPFAFVVMSKNKAKDMAILNNVGIDTRTIFGGNILEHPAFKSRNFRAIGSLPESNKILHNAYFVGVGPHLTVEDMEFIGKNIKKLRDLS